MKAPDPISQKGELILYTGPMNSGKTETLVKHALNLQNHAHQKILGFSVNENKRDGLNQIIGENGDKIDAFGIHLNSPESILDFVHEADKYSRVDVVVLDEISFYNHKIIDVVNNLRSDNRLVMGAGLDKNFRGEPFKFMPQLKEMVNPDFLQSTTFNSYCKMLKEDKQCSNLATYTVRLSPEFFDDVPFYNKDGDIVKGYGFAPFFDPLIFVEESDTGAFKQREYTAACESCFKIPYKEETLMAYESLISGKNISDINVPFLDKMVNMLIDEHKIKFEENGFFSAYEHVFDMRSGTYIPKNNSS